MITELRYTALPPGHVQTHTLDRDPALTDARTLSQIGMEVLWDLRFRDCAGTAHGFLNRCAHFRVEARHGGIHDVGGYTERLGDDVVEFLGIFTQRCGAVLPHVVENRLHDLGLASSVPISARGIASSISARVSSLPRKSMMRI